MKRTILMAITLLALLPDVAKGQWTFDIVSVEAYINDHKKQRSLLLARSTLEYSNQLLHEYPVFPLNAIRCPAFTGYSSGSGMISISQFSFSY